MTLQAAGYNGRLKSTDPESPAVIIAAAAISWALERQVQAEGFVAAMKRRDRRKAISPKAKFA